MAKIAEPSFEGERRRKKVANRKQTVVDTESAYRIMDKLRMVGNIDTYDGQQNLEEWIRMVEKTAAFTGWNDDNTFKAAVFRLRGEASEHIEQLKTEGQINSWEDTKRALKARFETSGKEQLYQHLLNTGTQGTKTVQEWAQVVRNLSIRALGAGGMKTEGERDNGVEDAEAVLRHAAEKEANKAVTSFMRKTNFIRGLRSNLRQVVWRKKCETFDEAVAVATEEEALEMAHKEEEVLSCYQSEIRGQQPLINSIVAALEAREVEKEAMKVKQQETQSPVQHQKRTDSQNEEARYEEPGNHRYNNYRRQEYSEQLPLPSNGYRDNRGGNQRGPVPRQQNQWRYQNQPETDQRREDRERRLCFKCHRPGHMIRDCQASYTARPSGNGHRRLN